MSSGGDARWLRGGTSTPPPRSHRFVGANRRQLTRAEHHDYGDDCQMILAKGVSWIGRAGPISKQTTPQLNMMHRQRGDQWSATITAKAVADTTISAVYT